MRLSILFTLTISAGMLLSGCSFSKKRKLTTLNPNTSTPSQGVINASGNALTMGIPNGAPSKVGTESSGQNAANIANAAIGRAKNSVLTSKNIDSLNDLNFVNRSYLNEAGDIRKSRAILSTSKNKLIKDYASMVLNDHQKIQKELADISVNKNIAIADSIGSGLHPIQNTANQINSGRQGTTTDQLDLEYLQSMIDDHKSAIELFTGGAKSNNPEIKSFANKNLPILRKHLKAAQELKKTLSAQ